MFSLPHIVTIADVRRAEQNAMLYCSFNGPKSKQCKKYAQIADELYIDFMKQFMILDDDDSDVDTSEK